MDDASNNCLEIILNLIYLAKHSASEAADVERYLTEAETQVLRLAVIHRRMTLEIEARR